MKFLNIKFLLLFAFLGFILFLNILDDSLLLLLNFLVVLLSLFFFLRNFFSGFIYNDIEELYSKYVYYYELNFYYLLKLKKIYVSQYKYSRIQFLKLYFSLFNFYKVNFINLLLNSHFLCLVKVDSFLFNFLENEIMGRRAAALLSLSKNLNTLELDLFDFSLSGKK